MKITKRYLIWTVIGWLILIGAVVMVPSPAPATADDPPPGAITGVYEEDEPDEEIEVEAPPEEESEPPDQGGEGDAPVSSPSEPPSRGEDKEPASEPSPTNNPSPPQPPKEPESKPQPEPQPPANPNPGGGNKPPAVPSPALPPPPPPEPGVTRIALCSDTPLPRVGQPSGRYHPTNAEEVQKYLNAGYKPAIYVEDKGTMCLLSEVGARAQDYILDPGVLASDGGLIVPLATAQAMGGSVIHPFYRKK